MIFDKNESMRADRLVSLVLLLRQRGRMTARALASELEVSPRTVLRDIEALSTAGVPVYADRGRHGGFSLLPGFRSELTGLNHDEALALLTASAVRSAGVFGLGSALTSAMLKVIDALPESHRINLDDAARRLLVEPSTDLLSRSTAAEKVPAEVINTVRQTVLSGHRLSIHYAAPAKAPRWHTVDPIGLVTVRDRTYLLAATSGEDRTYRLTRILTAVKLPDPAERPTHVDLDRVWAERAAGFLASSSFPAVIRVHSSRREELLNTVRAVQGEEAESDSWLRMEVSFQDLQHAMWAIWQLDTDAEVISPDTLRVALHKRATVLAEMYGARGRPTHRHQ